VQTFPHGNPSYDLAFTGPRAAFDGTDYVVLWRVSDYGGSVDRDTVRFRRVGVNGGLASAPADVYPTPGTAFWQIVHPRLACRGDGSCLVAWVEWDGEPADPEEGFVRNTYAARIVGDQVLNDPPIVLLADTDFNNHFALGLAASDDGYAVTNLRRDCPSGAEVCRFDLFAARVSPTGVTLDPGGIQLNHPPSQGIPYARPLGLTFDGTSYVATFFDLAATPSTDYSLWPPPEGYTQGYPIFAARLKLDGTVVNDEPIGLLVHDGRTALSGEVVRTTAGSLVVWQDVRHDTPILKRSFYAQRISPPSGS
jgi:hypothetical protein